MTVYFLLALILVLSMWLNPLERASCVVFTVASFSFFAISIFIPKELFHACAAIFDLSIAFLLNAIRFPPNNKVSIVLMVASLVCVVINIIGWILYSKGYTAMIYDGLGIGLYILTVIIIGLRIGKNGDRRWSSRDYADICSGSSDNVSDRHGGNQ